MAPVVLIALNGVVVAPMDFAVVTLAICGCHAGIGQRFLTGITVVGFVEVPLSGNFINI